MVPLLNIFQSNTSILNSTITLPDYGSFSGKIETQTLSGYDLVQPVQSWLGIEYSTQPIGEGRFAPTSHPAAFEGVRNTTKFGNVCPQPTEHIKYPELHGIGEDCLSMNVFRPLNTKSGAELPVLVFVHGVCLS